MPKFENLDRFCFSGIGKYDIPQMEPVTNYPIGEFIPMNYANTAKNPADKIVHYFVDDYQFARYWNRPDDYIKKLSQFAAVCSPDFSLYTDMPVAMQIYNHYRKHWLGAYWQYEGLLVIPTISWSDHRSYDWCFDGEPVGGCVAVSAVGTQMAAAQKQLFIDGYREMMDRLKPSKIIFYGDVPDECYGNIVQIQAFQDTIKKRRKEAQK